MDFNIILFKRIWTILNKNKKIRSNYRSKVTGPHGTYQAQLASLKYFAIFIYIVIIILINLLLFLIKKNITAISFAVWTSIDKVLCINLHMQVFPRVMSQRNKWKIVLKWSLINKTVLKPNFSFFGLESPC